MKPLEPVNLKAQFAGIDDYWSPLQVAQVNSTAVRLAKFKDALPWHSHQNEDEMFLVIKGELTMRLRGGEHVVREGEMIVVPRGTEHSPYAAQETWVLMCEPETTRKLGDTAC